MGCPGCGSSLWNYDWLADFADELEGGTFAYSEADGSVVYADEIDME